MKIIVSSQNAIPLFFLSGIVVLTLTLAEVLTPQDAKAILNLHNDYRRQESASNMYLMHWNVSLQERADSWAHRCLFKHERNLDLGENLFFDTDHENGVFARGMDEWHKEKSIWGYTSQSCSAACHYTQLIWGYTTTVGCSANVCPSLTVPGKQIKNAMFLVCYYYPRGNFIGDFPFARGRPCSECATGDTCSDGLCISSGPISKLAPEFVRNLAPQSPLVLSRSSHSFQAFMSLIQQFTSGSSHQGQHHQQSHHRSEHQEKRHHFKSESVLSSGTASHSYSSQHSRTQQHHQIYQSSQQSSQQQRSLQQSSPQQSSQQQRSSQQSSHQQSSHQQSSLQQSSLQQSYPQQSYPQQSYPQQSYPQQSSHQLSSLQQSSLQQSSHQLSSHQQHEHEQQHRRESHRLKEHERQVQHQEESRRQEVNELERQTRMEVEKRQIALIEEQKRQKRLKQENDEKERLKKHEEDRRQRLQMEQDRLRKVNEDQKKHQEVEQSIYKRLHEQSPLRGTELNRQPSGLSNEPQDYKKSEAAKISRQDPPKVYSITESPHDYNVRRYLYPIEVTGITTTGSSLQEQNRVQQLLDYNRRIGNRSNYSSYDETYRNARGQTQATITTQSSNVRAVIKMLSNDDTDKTTRGQIDGRNIEIVSSGHTHRIGARVQEARVRQSSQTRTYSQRRSTNPSQTKVVDETGNKGNVYIDEKQSLDDLHGSRKQRKRAENVRQHLRKKWKYRPRELRRSGDSHPHKENYVMDTNGQRCVDRHTECVRWATKCHKSSAVTLSCPMTCGKCGFHLIPKDVQQEQNTRTNPIRQNQLEPENMTNHGNKPKMTTAERRARRHERRLAREKKGQRAPMAHPGPEVVDEMQVVRRPNEERKIPREQRRLKGQRRTKPSSPPTARQEICRDDPKHVRSCKYWAKKNFCLENKLIGNIYCRLSCGSCE